MFTLVQVNLNLGKDRSIVLIVANWQCFSSFRVKPQTMNLWGQVNHGRCDSQPCWSMCRQFVVKTISTLVTNIFQLTSVCLQCNDGNAGFALILIVKVGGFFVWSTIQVNFSQCNCMENNRFLPYFIFLLHDVKLGFFNTIMNSVPPLMLFVVNHVLSGTF